MLKLFLIWVIGGAIYFVATFVFLKLDEKKYGREGFQQDFFILWIISIPLWYISAPIIIGITIWFWCHLLLIKLGVVKEPQQP